MIYLGFLLRENTGGTVASGTHTVDEESKEKSNNIHFLRTMMMWSSIEEVHVRDHHKSGTFSQEW
jgi:hypothetical protein